MPPEFTLNRRGGVVVLALKSEDQVNRLTRAKVQALTEEITALASGGPVAPLIISGDPIFSAGADLHEISRLNATSAYEFAKMGQRLMALVENHPAPVYAAIHGYCMGGGLDLALACHHRIAHPHACSGIVGRRWAWSLAGVEHSGFPASWERLEPCKCLWLLKSFMPTKLCASG